RQVVGKELGLPERDGRADDHEERDEDVTGGIAEVALQVTLEDGPDHVEAERPGAAVSFRRCGRRLAGRFGLERGHRGNPLQNSGQWSVNGRWQMALRPSFATPPDLHWPLATGHYSEPLTQFTLAVPSRCR